MNCEQTLKNLPHLVQQENVETREQISNGISRRALLEHLRTCPECQMEYEALWNTASILESVDEPTPPPELAGNIQQRIRHLHKRQQVALFANPLVWCLDRLKLDFSPRFVNTTALLFYIIASCFFVKLAFFTNPQEPEFGLTAMEKTRLQQVRISPTPWGSMKNTKPKAENRHIPQQAVIAVQQGRNHFFTTTRDVSETWRTNTVTISQQTNEPHVANYHQTTASEKLTVFWNQIKTEL
ncbi:MAG: hypothetical protein OXN25_11420 [Candidatus Poribacteria bacterium]|nr:hypothetical protein [Candidatus Poribacteria bacterium]